MVQHPSKNADNLNPPVSGIVIKLPFFASSVGFSFFLCAKVLPLVLSRSKVFLPAKSGNGISLPIKS